MRIIHISDTHSQHRKINDLPVGDVVIHSGDFSFAGTEDEALDFIEENINGQLDSCGEPIELIKEEVFVPLNHIYESCQVWLQHGANKDISFAKYLIDKHFEYHNADIVLSKIWCLLGK